MGLRPYDVQVMGALAMHEGYVAEMATGEGKTITAAMIASLWALEGQPVHIITVNDYLVQRDATEMGPIYQTAGPEGRLRHPRDARPASATTTTAATSSTTPARNSSPTSCATRSSLARLRNAPQTMVGSLMHRAIGRQLLVPGLFRVIVDEADSLLIDEAVTPLIISNSPDDDANATLYRAADELAQKLVKRRAFHDRPDRPPRRPDRARAATTSTNCAPTRASGAASAAARNWSPRRSPRGTATSAMSSTWSTRETSKVQIIDEFTGRIMADRSWRHGLHQAIEVKEGVPVTSDKENLARLELPAVLPPVPDHGAA